MADVTKRVVISEELSEQINAIAKERHLYPADVIRHVLEDYVEAKRNGLSPIVVERLNEMTNAIQGLSYILETRTTTMQNSLDTISNLQVSDNYLLDKDGSQE